MRAFGYGSVELGKPQDLDERAKLGRMAHCRSKKHQVIYGEALSDSQGRRAVPERGTVNVVYKVWAFGPLLGS